VGRDLIHRTYSLLKWLEGEVSITPPKNGESQGQIHVGGRKIKCSPTDFQTPILPTKNNFSLKTLFLASSLLLHHFFLSIDMAPDHERLSLYTMTLNDERRVTLFTILSIFVLP
jgi:hypothetical protein